jgi:hypothetical protein
MESGYKLPSNSEATLPKRILWLRSDMPLPISEADPKNYQCVFTL